MKMDQALTNSEPKQMDWEIQIMSVKAKSDEKTFIIIGTGAAGNTAAETLRKDGFDGRIIMVTRESCLPYDRTELSKKYLKSENSIPPILRSEE
ncbi:NAD(FAD)-dependent dehydrogenase, partial [Candidatus Poribacteria bacterium]|nr:NAD(FAD)-dependent dehydrogenase [Candidatus Poribacteria bacterium]